MDGLDLRSVSVAELRSRIRLTFQIPLSITIRPRERILSWEAFKRKPSRRRHSECRVVRGCSEVIARLPTNLRHHFRQRGGQTATELSGGEWQRIANARAFVRKGRYSAAGRANEHDGLVERSRLVRQIPPHLAAGRTAVIITHRLSIAMRAHLIYVMMKGQLVECGSHQELLARGGHLRARGICKRKPKLQPLFKVWIND